MPFCPSCGTEYQPGFSECADCGVALTDTPPVPGGGAGVAWVEIYTGRNLELRLVEDDLKSRGITAVRQPFAELGGQYEVGIFGTQETSVYTLSVPSDQFTRRQAEIEEAVRAVVGSLEGNADAMAEAEQDYDVRACPTCRRFFHDNYTTCPLGQWVLVPAVEIFRKGQLQPDFVVVADGEEEAMAAVSARLKGAGFHARVVSPEGADRSLVDMPWTELTDRTAEAEAVLGPGGEVPGGELPAADDEVPA